MARNLVFISTYYKDLSNAVNMLFLPTIYSILQHRTNYDVRWYVNDPKELEGIPVPMGVEIVKLPIIKEIEDAQSSGRAAWVHKIQCFDHIKAEGCYDRVIRLDCDAIVQNSLDELFEMDMGNNVLAGVFVNCPSRTSTEILPHLPLPSLGGARPLEFYLNEHNFVDEDDPYEIAFYEMYKDFHGDSSITNAFMNRDRMINGGMYVVDVNNYIAFGDDYLARMSKEHGWFITLDEDILAFAFGNRTKGLPKKWNYCLPHDVHGYTNSDYAIEFNDAKEANVIHYMGYDVWDCRTDPEDLDSVIAALESDDLSKAIELTRGWVLAPYAPYLKYHGLIIPRPNGKHMTDSGCFKPAYTLHSKVEECVARILKKPL